MPSLETAVEYHEATKHHPTRLARSLGYLDWDNQPNPFRRFAGTPTLTLPLAEGEPGPSYAALYHPGAVEPSPVNRNTIGLFLECSLAISAWKRYKHAQWSLRVNPSSGNLHPTEGYLVCGPTEGIDGAPGVYHYAPKEHALEQRASFDADAWAALIHGFPPHTFLMGLTSIHWRESWKYGERAYRYCQHDAGHALGALVFGARVLGWRTVVLSGLGDETISALLGLDRDEDFPVVLEREAPELVAAIVPGPWDGVVPRTPPGGAIDAVAAGDWRGKAEPLSADHVDWTIIEAVDKACRKPATEEAGAPCAHDLRPAPETGGPSAYRIIRQRRSAVDMDGLTGLERTVFYRMLARLMPGEDAIPWSSLGKPAAVHPVFFVHRIEDLPPGLYALPRSDAGEQALREELSDGFQWRLAEDCPEGLPFYLLAPGNCESVAADVSCTQAIAGEGAFAVAMLAEFSAMLERHGPWFYRRLHWEAGLLGQILYLEAEAAGVRSTGIGCFFDDMVHELLGLEGLTFQTLYHFTVGGPVDDPRLTTLPAYGESRRTGA